MKVQVSKSLSPEQLLFDLARANALNFVGNVSFNKYGIKDDIGLEPCTDIFVDNFVLQLLVPDYLIEVEAKGKIYMEASTMTKCIWNLLKRQKMFKSSVTTCGLAKIKGKPSVEMKTHMPFADHARTVQDYYVQDFKVTCSNEILDKVITFLQTNDHEIKGLFLKDIDVTQDFKGTLDKNDTIEHLLNNDDFQFQGDGNSKALFTILDNDMTVGNNCLTFIGTFMGLKVRCKFYNKMVQMLESKAVREQIGNHWFNWVNQSNTRLAAARDQSKDRGLTRIEISITSSRHQSPSKDYIEKVILMEKSLIDKELVYSTPHSSTWKTFCDSFIHSLVVTHDMEDLALVVYSYNELTNKISGHLYQHWSANKDWIFSNLVLSGELPIDWIDIETNSDHRNEDDETVTSSDTMSVLLINGFRLFKYQKNYGTSFKTRLVNTNAYFTNAREISESEAEKRLETAGFIAHKNCIPLLSVKAANKKSKVDVAYESVTELLISTKTVSQDCSDSLDIRKIELQKRIDEISHQKEIVNARLNERQFRMKYIELIKQAKSRSNFFSLLDLIGQTMDIIAIEELECLVGRKFALILKTMNGKYINSISTKPIEDQITAELDCEKLLVRPFHIMTIFGNSIGQIKVIDYEWTAQRHKTPICQLIWSSREQQAQEVGEHRQNVSESMPQPINQQNIEEIEQEKSSSMPPSLNIQVFADQIPQCSKAPDLLFEGAHLPEYDIECPKLYENASASNKPGIQLPYRHLPGLNSLKVNTLMTIVKMMWLKHYKKDKLVVQLNNDMYYQAGNNLENQYREITLPQKIVVIGSKLNISSRKREAVCELLS